MKLSEEETQFISSVLEQEQEPHFDVLMRDKQAEEAKQWLCTLSQATDIQLVAKVNSELVYFPAHLHTSEDGTTTFSCDVPNIFAADSSRRHWITKQLSGIVLKVPTLGPTFTVLSLSLSGLVIRTHPFIAKYLQHSLTQTAVTILLPHGRHATFDVVISQYVNDTALALEIMDIHDGLGDLKQTIFELYSQSLREF
ncbi:hypothetical protein ACSLBF_10150 [Pseudoalteromonas sp. T1lg65]|uniref:hypothetical protein n=1 Tax=Pseudoalteromonas sp. T1lg65 TaxID=2077101 RepID=UPI003F7B3327